MCVYEFLRLLEHLLEIVAWPSVAMYAIFIIRPYLNAVLSGAKIKLSFGGQTIETTLPELEQVLVEQVGEKLPEEQVNFLILLQQKGAKQYEHGITDSEAQKFLRPLRNAGLILTIPRNSFLNNAKAIELSALGRLYLRANRVGVKSGT